MKKNPLNIFFAFFDKYPREFYIIWIFVIFAFSIVYKTFSYTIINQEYYKGLAVSQQTSELSIPVTRGSIYSNNDKGKVLATSVDLNNLAIDPQIEGNKEKLTNYLTDIVYKQTCYLQSKKDCYYNILKFLRLLDIEGFKDDQTFQKDLIRQEIIKKINRTKITSVLIKEGLDEISVAKLEELNLAGVYINKDNLYVNPEEILDDSFVANKLIEIIGGKQEDMEYYIRKRDLKYVPIINKLSISISDEIKDMIEEEKKAINMGLMEREDTIYRYLILNAEQQRFYPENNLASQVIGFVDNNGEGAYGIEGYFNSLLKGKKGTMTSKKDTSGRIIDPFSLKEEETAEAGVDITTTIDRNIQKKVEELLEAGVKEYKANKGSVVIMNPKTGEIIAMANYPTFDPNSPGDVYELEKVSYAETPNPAIDLLGKEVLIEDNIKGKKYYYDGKNIYLRKAEKEELGGSINGKYKFINDFGPGVYKNDIISNIYEPGSIMKPITVAIGLDSGEISRYEMYQDKGYVEIDNFTIKNVDSKCTGYNSIQHGLNYSCNVCMVYVVQKIGKPLISQYLEDFGFGKLTGITLEGEVYTKIEPYQKWSRAKLFTTSYGLGISMTPLQMATAYSILANGGIYMQPYIVKSIKFADGKEVVNSPTSKHIVIQESTSKIITNMLVDAVNNGVANKAQVEGYSIAGKTGTSQIAYKGSYETGEGSTTGSFAGYAPAEDPKFVVVVKLDRPRTSEYGGNTSAVIFKNIATYLFDYYGIPKKE